MSTRDYDFDRYTFDDDFDYFYHDDGSHSLGRRKELDFRRFTGYDTYTGDPEDYLDWETVKIAIRTTGLVCNYDTIILEKQKGDKENENKKTLTGN